MRKTRNRRGFVLLAVVSAIATGLLVSPAAAAPSAGTTLADSCGMFDSLTMLANSASAARGDEAREPDVDQIVQELPESAKGKGGKSFRATVPVWFHVVHAGGVGNISQAVIDEQMNVLNLAFGGFYGGVNTGFKFRLAGVTRTDNAAWHFAGISGKDARDMKKALHRGGWDTMNLYATTAGPYLGWAYFPGLPESQQYLDGIVVDWESMPGASSRYAGRFDLGHTATHEAGHWVHLHHTFNGGCNNWGDYVEDTPPMRVPTSRCPIGKDTCAEPGLDPIHNYMDYSDDPCYNQFTAGQTARMQDAWLHFRAG